MRSHWIWRTWVQLRSINSESTKSEVEIGCIYKLRVWPLWQEENWPKKVFGKSEKMTWLYLTKIITSTKCSSIPHTSPFFFFFFLVASFSLPSSAQHEFYLPVLSHSPFLSSLFRHHNNFLNFPFSFKCSCLNYYFTCSLSKSPEGK